MLSPDYGQISLRMKRRTKTKVLAVVVGSQIRRIVPQLKKVRRHNESAIDRSKVNPARGHKEVRRSTGHIIVTIRYITKPTGIQIAEISLPGPTTRPRTSETYRRQDDVFFICGNYSFYCLEFCQCIFRI